MELAGRTLTVDVGRVAAQANGAALMHYGDTTVLCTATASEKPRDGIDFFPLSVEYEEKLYAVGKKFCYKSTTFVYLTLHSRKFPTKPSVHTSKSFSLNNS